MYQIESGSADPGELRWYTQNSHKESRGAVFAQKHIGEKDKTRTQIS